MELLHFINDNKVPDHVQYLLLMDAFDTVLLGDASKIDEAFESYDAQMVAIGTSRNFPLNPELQSV